MLGERCVGSAVQARSASEGSPLHPSLALRAHKPGGKRNTHSVRSAATLVESAVVLALTFLLLFGVLIGSAGVFQRQQLAAMAREAARYASVHGGQYRYDAGLAPGTASDWQADVYANALAPYMVGLDPSRFNYEITWSNNDDWPTRVTTNNGKAVTNRVTVTVSYAWIPPAYLSGITLMSTSTLPVSY
jgi:type II secretory pathway pseudopilin PulG